MGARNDVWLAAGESNQQFVRLFALDDGQTEVCCTSFVVRMEGPVNSLPETMLVESVEDRERLIKLLLPFAVCCFRVRLAQLLKSLFFVESFYSVSRISCVRHTFQPSFAPVSDSRSSLLRRDSSWNVPPVSSVEHTHILVSLRCQDRHNHPANSYSGPAALLRSS